MQGCMNHKTKCTLVVFCSWGKSALSSEGAACMAVQVALDGEPDAALQAISRTARHRQDRGIWTSTGAGALCSACLRVVKQAASHHSRSVSWTASFLLRELACWAAMGGLPWQNPPAWSSVLTQQGPHQGFLCGQLEHAPVDGGE